MNILFCGDIVGRSGRDVLKEQLPLLKEKYAIDFTIVNGENAAGGFGLTDKICKELFGAGIDVITSGNHMWDKREVMPYIDQEVRLLRPANFPKNNPGRGYHIYRQQTGQSILVINLMGQVFMPPTNDPFEVVEEILAHHQLGRDMDFALVDFHAQAESEKQSMGVFCDGKVTAVLGTHTHVPTADYRILNEGTAYQTDVGMCGDYQSIIGMDREEPLKRFRQKVRYKSFSTANGEGTVRGIVIEADDKTGLAKKIIPIEVGQPIYQERV